MEAVGRNLVVEPLLASLLTRWPPVRSVGPLLARLGATQVPDFGNASTETRPLRRIRPRGSTTLRFAEIDMPACTDTSTSRVAR